MQSLSPRHDDEKYTRMVRRDALLLLLINLIVAPLIVLFLWLATKYDW
jgi:uncharacterized protein involved in exopolysaccharide biosynthesis